MGGQDLAQDPIYNLESHLSYLTKALAISFDYYGHWGGLRTGRQKVG